MDSQQTPRPPVDFAAAQNANASVKSAIQQQPQQLPFAATSNNGPLDGPPRFQQPQQFPGPGAAAGPRPGYGPVVGQRAPGPRPPFFGRPPQPGQGPPRFPPPRPPPAGYAPGPQGFPLGRPPFPPLGVDPRFLRPQHPPGPPPQHPPPLQQQQQQAVLRRQTSLAEGRMAEAEQSRPTSAVEAAADQQSKDKTVLKSDLEQQSVQPAKPDSPVKEDEQKPLDDKLEQPAQERPGSRMIHGAAATLPEAPQQDAPISSGPRAQSAAPAIAEAAPQLEAPSEPSAKTPASSARVIQSAGPTLSEAPNQEQAPSAPPKTPSSDSSSIRGFDEGRRKSLSTPISSPTQLEPSALQLVVDGDTSTSASPHPKRATPVADATAAAAVSAASADQAPSQRAGATARVPPPPDSKEPRIVKKSPSARSIKQDAENDSGVDESTQRREAPKSNGVSSRTPSKTRDADKRSAAGSPVKSPNKSIKSLPRTPDAAPPTTEKKKVPMNKVQVGAAPSPNLKAVRSKIGSLENATHKPGGGKVKIENRKLDFSSAQPKIAAKNDKYTPSGGDKKIEQVKLQWNAKPKIGSLENATYKPGGGNKKIETVKLDFKDKAKPKVGSKENAKHVPGGGSVKSSATSPKTPQDNNVNIESQKLEFKAESKVGSMDNMKHRPGGGDKKIFDDKSYLRQTSSNVGSVSGSGSQVAPRRPNSLVGLSPSDKRSSFDSPQPPPSTPTRSRNPVSLSAATTPGSVRTGFDKTPETPSAGKKSLPGSPRKNKSTKELLLPKLSPLNSDHPTIETHKTKQTRVTLPNLQK